MTMFFKLLLMSSNNSAHAHTSLFCTISPFLAFSSDSLKIAECFKCLILTTKRQLATNIEMFRFLTTLITILNF